MVIIYQQKPKQKPKKEKEKEKKNTQKPHYWFSFASNNQIKCKYY